MDRTAVITRAVIAQTAAKNTWRERLARWLLGADAIDYVKVAERIHMQVARATDRYVIGEIVEVLSGTVVRVNLERDGDLIQTSFFVSDIVENGGADILRRDAHAINPHSIMPPTPTRLLAIPPEVLGKINERLR